MIDAKRFRFSRLGLATAAVLAITSGALGITAGVTAASAEDYGPMKVMDTSAGKVLTDANGMTVYTFDKDAAGKSNCNGECAKAWPPVMATAADKPVGGLTIIKRDDGSLQWADDGKPIYTFVKDKKPGDVTGDNMKNVWHAVME